MVQFFAHLLAYTHNVEQSCAVWTLLQLLYDRRMRSKSCRTILNHVLKPYDSRRYSWIEWQVLYTIFCMAWAGRATEVACDSSKQKSYRLNRP